MPSESARQHNLMELVAHDPAAAHRLHIPQSVGHDFVEADKRANKHFAHHAPHNATAFHEPGHRFAHHAPQET